MNRWASMEGTPAPLGVSFVAEDEAYNFALYSKHATAVVLLLYAAGDAATPIHAERLLHPKNKSGRVWHCRLPAPLVRRAAHYGYRVEGPSDPAAGHRFDAAKVLLDPYARAVFFPPGYDRRSAIGAGANDGRAALGVIHVDGAARERLPRPHGGPDAVIYELHVRGFTRHKSSGVAPERRGTYLGVIERIPHMKELGVTVVELLPVFQRDPQERNYWGYMTLGFFAPEESYASVPGAQLEEFRTMVRALHDAGIEVVLDVAYNHTCEADQNGPTHSFRGIDNSTYYLLEDDRRWYRNDAGCGNVLHTANRYVRKMIVDSLRWWLAKTGVDGFRFDMASIFSRNEDGSINLQDPPIIGEISSMPDFENVRLIAEPWDLATSHLGRSFPGATWAQWNSRFRDDVRSFVRGDRGLAESVVARLYGSEDLFPDTLIDAYRPHQSINYVTCHDGFTLYDLVAYDAKHNLANGEDNRDGMDDNRSWNCGWEGDDRAPDEVLALRKRQVKNFCALLMLANGTPMFVAGDEFMHTQRGNNNPYNQDNEVTWLDWDRLERNRDVFRFFRGMIAFRKAQAIARSGFWRGDVSWYGAAGVLDRGGQSHALAFCLRRCGADGGIYAMINAGPDDATFVVQAHAAWGWRRVVDTSLPSPEDFLEPGSEAPVGASYTVRGRSVVVLAGAS